MKIKPIYLIGSALALGGGLYLILRKPKGGGGGGDDKLPLPSSADPTARPKDVAQNKISPKLDTLLASGKIKGVKLYTKVDNVTLRKSATVNDGSIANNIYGKMPNKERFIGVATGKVVVEQGKDRKNPLTGKDYRWVQFNISKFAFDKINDAKAFFLKDYFSPYTSISPLWVRDDVVFTP
jgi:hypothetical protein